MVFAGVPGSRLGDTAGAGERVTRGYIPGRKSKGMGIPAGPVIRESTFQCRGRGFLLGQGTKIPCLRATLNPHMPQGSSHMTQ